MHIRTEGSDFVVLDVSLKEAGRIAADILSQEAIAGDKALAVARKLREAGFYLQPAVSGRSEWAGPVE
ncbi:MAG: hypothetical protein ACYCTF_01630 [Acidiferrobacter sp.]